MIAGGILSDQTHMRVIAQLGQVYREKMRGLIRSSLYSATLEGTYSVPIRVKQCSLR